jgi:hypothetical protein
MAEKAASGRPGYVVLRQVGEDHWQGAGYADRKPGQTARKARAEAVRDATGGAAKPGESYRAVLRGQWRIASDL